MSNQIITPLEVGNISVGDDIRIYVPTLQDDLGVPLEYGLTQRGRVTSVDVDHDGVQAVVKLDTDPPDTDEEVFAGYLIGGGNGNLIAIRVSIEDDRSDAPQR